MTDETDLLESDIPTQPHIATGPCARSHLLEVFSTFLRLGLSSFGGPVAHIGYFHAEFVRQRKWVNDATFADLVGLCHFLPGPSSTQVGMALGLQRAGTLGAFAAWLGFTLPSAFLMILFAIGVTKHAATIDVGWVHSLKVVAVAIVAHAIFSMGSQICVDKKRLAIASLACLANFRSFSTEYQVMTLFVAGLFGLCFLVNEVRRPRVLSAPKKIHHLSKLSGGLLLSIFLLLLFLLPVLAKDSGSALLFIVDSFYRAGSMVFGGGHVVLPLLQTELVPRGWLTNEVFMAGYGAAQALPGPLFSFAGYLGTASQLSLHGWSGGLLALAAIFAPSFFLVLGIMPFWEKIRHSEYVQGSMAGVQAAVVGVLAAAFYNPVWSNGVHNLKDLFLALVSFALLAVWKVPSWFVVALGAIYGLLLL